MGVQAGGRIAKTRLREGVDPVIVGWHYGCTKHRGGAEPDVVRPPGITNSRDRIARLRAGRTRSESWKVVVGVGPMQGWVAAFFTIWWRQPEDGPGRQCRTHRR